MSEIDKLLKLLRYLIIGFVLFFVIMLLGSFFLVPR